MRRLLIWLPFALFIGLFAVVASGLYKPADRTVRSAMIGKPLPQFSLPPIIPTKPGLGSAVFRQGQPRLLNVFASWCIPCAAEAPQLKQLKAIGVPIDAVAIRDTGSDIASFLARYGDPYDRIGDDPESAVQLALGSSGVPETFVIDGKGIIRLQHVGEIRAEDVPGILDALRQAQ
ncbi:MAG: alkyl hydroperoxide reductase [Sphingomonas sp. 28-66-16]|nr:MAG: alkyl hydroperoxide reductase [Sphingomonas sp. 28-66-16]